MLCLVNIAVCSRDMGHHKKNGTTAPGSIQNVDLRRMLRMRWTRCTNEGGQDCNRVTTSPNGRGSHSRGPRVLHKTDTIEVFDRQRQSARHTER